MNILFIIQYIRTNLKFHLILILVLSFPIILNATCPLVSVPDDMSRVDSELHNVHPVLARDRNGNYWCAFSGAKPQSSQSQDPYNEWIKLNWYQDSNDTWVNKDTETIVCYDNYLEDNEEDDGYDFTPFLDILCGLGGSSNTKIYVAYFRNDLDIVGGGGHIEEGIFLNTYSYSGSSPSSISRSDITIKELVIGGEVTDWISPPKLGKFRSGALETKPVVVYTYGYYDAQAVWHHRFEYYYDGSLTYLSYRPDDIKINKFHVTHNDDNYIYIVWLEDSESSGWQMCGQKIHKTSGAGDVRVLRTYVPGNTSLACQWNVSGYVHIVYQDTGGIYYGKIADSFPDTTIGNDLISNTSSGRKDTLELHFNTVGNIYVTWGPTTRQDQQGKEFGAYKYLSGSTWYPTDDFNYVEIKKSGYTDVLSSVIAGSNGLDVMFAWVALDSSWISTEYDYECSPQFSLYGDQGEVWSTKVDGTFEKLY